MVGVPPHAVGRIRTSPHALLHGWARETGIGEPIRERKRNPYNAYIQVFPSLHFLSKDFARSTRVTTRTETQPGAVVPFGLPYLDNMLARRGGNKGGLPQGSGHLPRWG